MRSVSSPMAVSMMIGGGGLGAQVAAQAEAVFAGHHDIEDQEIDARVGEDAAGLARVLGGGHAIAMLGEEPGQQVADLAIIVDDEQVGRDFHAGPSSFIHTRAAA